MDAALALQLLRMIQAGFGWLDKRGIQRDRVQFLIDRAVDEGRDVTSAEVNQELKATQAELDRTASLIAGMPAKKKSK